MLLGSASLSEGAVFADDFIHGDFPGSDLIGRVPDLGGHGIRDPDYFGREHPLGGHLAEGRVHGVEGQVRGRRDQAFYGSHFVQFPAGDQETL